MEGGSVAPPNGIEEVEILGAGVLAETVLGEFPAEGVVVAGGGVVVSDEVLCTL